MRLVVLVLALLCTAAAQAQVPSTTPSAGGSGRLRDRVEKPRQQQKLDEAIRKFGEEDVATRLEGVEALGQSADDPKAVEYLLRGAADPDLSVRVKSIDVIGDAKVKDAVPLLVQELTMRATTLATKQRILAALGKIGDPRATKPVLDFLVRDVDPTIRASAIYALGDLGDPAALPALQKVAKDTTDPNVHGLALSSIRRIEQRPLPTVLPPALAQDLHGSPGEGGNARP